ncbi:MAG TPA: hypothetical protein VD704_12890 [Gaiellaceae bacterium]|nr:hypothetical protein [Gaiellaceae bacterium]
MRNLRLSQALVLRVDALSNGALAAFLLAATWDGLYDFFGLPVAEPPFYAQLLGAALVAFAIVEWALAGTPGERAVTLAAAVGSAVAAAVLAIWLLAADTDLDAHGLVALWSVAAFLAAAAAIHAVVLVRASGRAP